MPRTKPYGIKFTPADYATLEAIAERRKTTVGKLVDRACQQLAESEGMIWEGTLKRGRPSKQKTQEGE
jgi:hypothetical protein